MLLANEKEESNTTYWYALFHPNFLLNSKNLVTLHEALF